MTSEWHEVPLRELVGYISKGIAPSYAEEASETTIRVLNQKCNRNFRISYGDSRLHDTLKKKVPPERYVKPDDILINSTGAGTAGRIAQIEDVPSATTIDGHMILIRSNGKVTQKFLGYALKAHQWEVLQLDEGSTGQTELNRDRLLDEIMINYPVSFDEQNAIVSKAAYPKFLEKLSICRDLFHGFSYEKFMTGSDLDRAKLISGGVNFILGKSVAEYELPDHEKTQNVFIKEALLLKQALSLCSSLVDEQTRMEAAFFESVRTMTVRLVSGGTGKKFTLPEVNERINELLKHSIKSEGVINLFSDVQTEFSLFDPKFLEEVANMKEKNLAVELLKKLISEQVSVYRRTNIVKSEKFSEIIQSAMNRYLNGMLTNEEVIQELLKLAKDIAAAAAEGEKLGLTADELAFYDALTKPQAIKDFYEHDELIAITKELTDLLRKNQTIDWQKKESARAGMRRLVKRLLKKHKYPPEGMDDAVQTVMSQCEMWTDNVMTA